MTTTTKTAARSVRTVRAAAVTILAALAPAVHAGVVEIAVTGIVQARGHVRVQLCTKDTFLKPTCPYEASAPATLGETVVKVNNVEPGEYAATAFHDESDQGVVHQNFLGIPRERIGFSNNASVHVHGPRFKDAAFFVGHEAQMITLKVRHLFRGD